MFNAVAQVRAACDAAQDPVTETKSLRVVMVRHGESTGNTLGNYFAPKAHKELLKALWPNEWHFPLTGAGVQQAKGVRSAIMELLLSDQKYLADNVVVYSSNMVRARQTMVEACNGWALEPCMKYDGQIGELIREKLSGPAIFTTREELQQQYPDRELTWERNPYTFNGGGESIQSCESRVLETMRVLVRKYCHEFSSVDTVILFTHGGYMMASERLASDMTIMEAKNLRSPHNCGVYEFEVSPYEFRLLRKHAAVKK